MLIFKVGREEIVDVSQKFVFCFSCGVLWGIIKVVEKIFLQVEKYFRLLICNGLILKINIEKIMLELCSDLEIIVVFNILLVNFELRIDKYVVKDVLQNILDLYIRVCFFFFVKDIVQCYKIQIK